MPVSLGEIPFENKTPLNSRNNCGRQCYTTKLLSESSILYNYYKIISVALLEASHGNNLILIKYTEDLKNNTF